MTRRGTVLHHSILTSESVSELDLKEKLIWTGLLLCADDWGRLPYKPHKLAMRMPAFGVTPHEVSSTIDKLIAMKCVEKYTVKLSVENRTITVIQLTNWEIYQTRLKSRDNSEQPAKDCSYNTTTNPGAKAKQKLKQKEKGRPVTVRSHDYKHKSVSKKKHGDIVELTDDEYTRLKNDYGERELVKKIQAMNDYLQMHGKDYKDYNAALRSWFRRDGIEKCITPDKANPYYDDRGRKPLKFCPSCLKIFYERSVTNCDNGICNYKYSLIKFEVKEYEQIKSSK